MTKIAVEPYPGIYVPLARLNQGMERHKSMRFMIVDMVMIGGVLDQSGIRGTNFDSASFGFAPLVPWCVQHGLVST